MYIYAESYGAVYRFTRVNWIKMLKEVAKGQDVDFDRYGKMICVVNAKITDLNAECARDLLNLV